MKASLTDLIRSELSRYSCYDLLPVSTKIVVLDTQLPVYKALAALTQHGTHRPL